VSLYEADSLLQLLSASGAALTDPLDIGEVRAIEERFGFIFGPDELLEERRRVREAGDPRFTDAVSEILLRLVGG
jgi:hypothetical protein